MTMVEFCRPVREAWVRACERCFLSFPCLSDPARRTSLCLKVLLLVIHIVYVGGLFLLDKDLRDKAHNQPWYIAIYIFLFVATLAQYFLTSGSSPGYVIDAMRFANESQAIFKRMSTTSKQSASAKNGGLIISVDGNQSGRNILGANSTTWAKLVMDMYPPETSISVVRVILVYIIHMLTICEGDVENWTCTYCNVMQPPRSKHCHDCDKCVLQFDHHCVWLGACIGQGNHCRFWWYIFEETTLSIWTCVLYISYLKSNFARAWWKDFIVIVLLAALSIALIFLILLLLFHSYLILTNQTTYELVRRRRILYLRRIPERVYPFSKGICRNIYSFCCARGSIYNIEPLPTIHELEVKSKPYTCCDVLSCRCC